MVTMTPLVVASIAALSAMAGGAVARAETGREPYVMERAEVWRVAAQSGARYPVYVSWPDAPPPAGGYPVLYVLDGDDNFAIAAKTASRMARFSDGAVEPGIVVGIGYADLAQRIFDYTPEIAAASSWRGYKTGGARAFRAFIRDELRPAIEAEFAVDRERQALMGHSFGGLFVLDTLVTEPSLFRTYIAASPSIWFGGEALFEKAGDLDEKLRATQPRLLALTVGELEQGARANSPAAVSEMIDDSSKMAKRLGERKRLAVRYRVLSGEAHGSSSLPAIAEAVTLSFSKAQP